MYKRLPNLKCMLHCAGKSVSMMIVVAVALLNDRGQILLSQRKVNQSFPGTMSS